MSSAWWYYPESLSKCVWSNAYTPRHPVQHVYLPCLFVAVLASCCAKPPSSHWLKQCPCLHVIGCNQLACCGIHYLCFSLFADTKQTEVAMATSQLCLLFSVPMLMHLFPWVQNGSSPFGLMWKETKYPLSHQGHLVQKYRSMSVNQGVLRTEIERSFKMTLKSSALNEWVIITPHLINGCMRPSNSKRTHLDSGLCMLESHKAYD